MNTQDINFGRCFSEGWAAFKDNIGIAIGAFVLYEVIHITLNYIPGLNFLYILLGMFPLIGGFTTLFLGIVKRLDPQIATLFCGFSGDQWARWMGLGWLVSLYFICAALICAIPAGLLVIGAYFAFGKSSPIFVAIAAIAGLAALIAIIAIIAISIRWSFVFFLGAEGATAAEAINTSTEWTKGIRPQIFWITLALALLGAAGIIALGIELFSPIHLRNAALRPFILMSKN